MMFFVYITQHNLRMQMVHLVGVKIINMQQQVYARSNHHGNKLFHTALQRVLVKRVALLCTALLPVQCHLIHQWPVLARHKHAAALGIPSNPVEDVHVVLAVGAAGGMARDAIKQGPCQDGAVGRVDLHQALCLPHVAPNRSINPLNLCVDAHDWRVHIAHLQPSHLVDPSHSGVAIVDGDFAHGLHGGRVHKGYVGAAVGDDEVRAVARDAPPIPVWAWRLATHVLARLWPRSS